MGQAFFIAQEIIIKSENQLLEKLTKILESHANQSPIIVYCEQQNPRLVEVISSSVKYGIKFTHLKTDFDCLACR